MRAFHLARKHLYQLGDVLKSIPSGWARQQKAYEYEDLKTLRKILARFDLVMGDYGKLRRRIDDEGTTAMRRLRLNTPNLATLELEGQKVRDQNFESTADLNTRYCGDEPVEVRLEDSWYGWLETNWKARNDWTGSNEAMEFVEAVYEAIEHMSVVSEEPHETVSAAEAILRSATEASLNGKPEALKTLASINQAKEQA